MRSARFLAVVGATMCMLLPVAAQAATAMWSTTIPGVLAAGHHSPYQFWYFYLKNTVVQIQYHADVVNASTGVSVCGQTVAAGTPLTAIIAAHQPVDVYWFTTGSVFDSPYGQWDINADPPGLNSAYVQGIYDPPTAPAAANMCSSNNYITTQHDGGLGANETRDHYVLFSVNPPGKTVAAPGGSISCGALSSGGTASCTANTAGSVDVQFDFSATNGKFYHAVLNGGLCWVDRGMNQVTGPDPNGPMTQDGQIVGDSGGGSGGLVSGGGSSSVSPAHFVLSVPAQSIMCPITVTGSTVQPPAPPTVTAGACVVNTPTTITFQATDPGGNQIRYGIDWNDDGTVDQFVPATGFVPSGTSLSSTRTYATDGDRVVKVMTENDKGMASGFTSVSFNCTQSPSCPAGQMLVGGVCVPISCPAGQHGGSGGVCLCDNTNAPPVNGSCMICPVGQHAVGNLCVCDGSNLPADQNGRCDAVVCPEGFQYDPTTQQCVRIQQCVLPPICSDNVRLLDQCTGVTTNCVQQYGAGWYCADGQCRRPPPPIASISAVPGLVHAGATSLVTWTSINTSSCSVTGNNSDGPWSGVNGSQVSKPIISQTVFTLACIGLDDSIVTKKAIVNVIPDWVEN